MPLRSGLRVLVQWEAGQDWQTRILLSRCSVPEFTAVLESAPTDASAELWYCGTPDGDVYPHA